MIIDVIVIVWWGAVLPISFYLSSQNDSLLSLKCKTISLIQIRSVSEFSCRKNFNEMFTSFSKMLFQMTPVKNKFWNDREKSAPITDQQVVYGKLRVKSVSSFLFTQLPISTMEYLKVD